MPHFLWKVPKNDHVVMDLDQNIRELSVNVISLLTICVTREIRKCQFSPFCVILSGKLANYSVISCEIAEITKTGMNGYSRNRTEVKLAFQREFFVNVKRNFSNFKWNHAENNKYFTQNHDKWRRFHANGGNWAHVHAQFTEILVAHLSQKWFKLCKCIFFF